MNSFRLILLITLLILAASSRAQYYTSVMVIPQHPTSLDSIFVVDSADLPYISMSLYFNKSTINGNDIIISQCYDHASGAAQIKSIEQTTSLGIFSPGSFEGVIYVHTQYDPTDTDCSQYGIRDSIRFSFTVAEPSGLQAIPETDLTISPNPTSGKVYLSHHIGDAQVMVQDLSGRTYDLPQTGREIDVSSLVSGVYALRLQTREGSVIRRFVRE